MKKLLCTMAVLALAGAANADVVNGGFETGDFTGWTTVPAATGSLFGVSSFAPHTGTFAAYFGAVTTAPDAIFQDVVTVPGLSYTLSFWLRNDGNGDNNIRVLWGRAPVLNNGDDAFGYQQYSFNVVGGAGLTTQLRIEAYDIPNYYYLDDVHVTPVPAPAAAAALGLGGLLAARRRR